MALFAKIIHHFCKRLHLRCLTGFWRRLCCVSYIVLFVTFFVSSDSKLCIFQLCRFPKKLLVNLLCNWQHNRTGKIENIPQSAPLREKCPYSELFWFAFFRILTEYGQIRGISPYSVRKRQNVDQNNSEYGHFLRSAPM